MRDADVKRTDNISAQLAASVCRKDVYMSELTAVMEDLGETWAVRASLQRSVGDLVSEVRQAFVDLGVVLQAVVESSNCSSEVVANKVKMKMDQAWKQMLFVLDLEYANAVRKIRANVVQDKDDVLRNVARCTAIILSCLDKSRRSLPAEGKYDTAGAGSIGPGETLGAAPMDCERPTAK